MLDEHGVELIGADVRAIQLAEDREQFAEAMQRIGLALPPGGFARSLDEALELVEETGFPAIIRPSFTLGGTGGSTAYNREEFEDLVRSGIRSSPIGEVLIDKSIIGWKEFELEVMRDRADNVVIVCSIENFDAMGIHTGDSITVAPALTLSDREYQAMRDAAIACIREIGVDAGGCNIQFAVHPTTGEMLVIEMNPRVSRSSALASKATGFPIARIGAKLAVGYRLDEIPNAITQVTPSCFEPVLDYMVVKIPRFAFEKFPKADATLGVQMKAVGEVMAIGRTFQQAWLKGFRALENGRTGWLPSPDPDEDRLEDDEVDTVRAGIRTATPERPFQLYRAFQAGLSVAEINRITGIDPWFLSQLEELVREGEAFAAAAEVTPEGVERLKRIGFGDAEMATVARDFRGRSARDAPGRGAPARLQDRRHLRGRIPRRHAVPLLDVRGRERIGALGPAQDHHPRQRPEPHRTGHRVRLLLRIGLARAARGRVRDDHDQLESRNRLHRLRHLQQALLRAADGGGRTRDRGTGEAGGRHRPVRGTDAADDRPQAGATRCPHPRDERRVDRPHRGPPPLRQTLPRTRRAHAAGRDRDEHRGGARDRGEHRVSRARPAQLRARRPRDGDRVRPDLAAGILRARGAGLSRTSRPPRPIPGGRLRGGRGCGVRR